MYSLQARAIPDTPTASGQVNGFDLAGKDFLRFIQLAGEAHVVLVLHLAHARVLPPVPRPWKRSAHALASLRHLSHMTRKNT